MSQEQAHFSMVFASAKIAIRQIVGTPWRGARLFVVPSCIALLFFAKPAIAVEPAEEFVKGLQERGMDDFAIEYLDRLKTSPLASDAIKKRIPYLRGVALVEQAKQSADPAERNKLLDAGRQELEQFAETNPNSVSGAEAQLQLATVQMTRGQELAAQCAQLPKEKAYDSQRKDLGREARLRFAEAHETFERAETTFNTELEKLPPTTSADSREEGGSKRQELRGRVAQLKFLAAQTRFEAAESYPPEADEFKKLHETAAEELSAVYDEFGRTMLVGLYARLFEGRCYQAVGNYALALGCYDELIGKDNLLGPFRKLAAASMQRKAEVLIAQNKLDVVIEGCNACLKDAHKDEEKLPEWTGVRYRLAEALAKKAAAANPESAEQRKLLSEAREAYRIVSKSSGEFQAAARTAAASPSAASETAATELNASKKSEGEDPRTFQAAYDAGKEALSSYNAAKLAIPSAEKNNPPAVPELQAQMERGKGDARHYFQVATSLVGTDTDPKLVNEVRYFLCWLYWDAEDYYRSAVLGEFLAKRYPDASTAASAAKIAMASYERLYNLAAASGNKKNNGDFEAQRMAQMAEFITRRWPGTESADSAFGVLVTFAIHANKPEEAEKLLRQVSAPSRPRLELMLGNALWTRYLELSQANQSTQRENDDLAKIKTTATKNLKSGFEAAKQESPLSEAGATAALYLVQAELSDGDFGDAIVLLEGASGPLSLIEKQDPTATKPAYEIETYKAALRAYVSVSPPQEKKAMSTMRSLEKVVQANVEKEKASEQLTRIYIAMGTALQKQMEELRAAGRQGEAIRVSAAFGKFLDRIQAGESSANWPTRVWLAQTYYTMGNDQLGTSHSAGSAASTDGVLNKVGRDYITKARDAYLQLLAEAAKDPKLAPNETATLAIRMQLADCYRALGEYDKCLDTYYDVLKEKETSLAAQRAAALAYQDRGQHEDAKWFENAIHGGYPIKESGQNRIWGWLRLAQIAGQAARRDPQFNDTFFEARFNISRCRYLAAMKQSGDVRRQELGKAKQTIQSVSQLYPDLGGEKWKGEFDTLLKQIQSAENDVTSDKNAEASNAVGKS